VIKAKLGARLDRWIHVLFPFLFKRTVNPNLLTVVGGAVSAGAACAFGLGHFPVGGVLLLAGGFFDLVDGVVARHFGRSTAFGAFLDSTLDRFVDMAVLLGIIVHYGLINETGLVLITGVVLMMSVITSYTKAKADLLVGDLKGGVLERGERVGLLAIGSILGLMEPILWILAVGTTLTVAQRFVTAHREMAEKPIPESGAGATGEERR
jgi:phosphatidylglycerophosphate synthase